MQSDRIIEIAYSYRAAVRTNASLRLSGAELSRTICRSRHPQSICPRHDQRKLVGRRGVGPALPLA